MTRLLFFGRLRDVAGEGERLVELPADIGTVSELRAWLANDDADLGGFESVGLSTLQSRACAGIAHGKFIFALPGSNGACRDGWEKIIRWQLDSRHTPCNLVEIVPRLLER